MTKQSIVYAIVALVVVIVLFPPYEYGAYSRTGVWVQDKLGVEYAPIWSPARKFVPRDPARKFSYDHTVGSRLDITRLLMQLGVVAVCGGLLLSFGQAGSPKTKQEEGG